MSRPNGFFYVPNLVSIDEANDLLPQIDKLSWVPLNHAVDTGRLVQHYGYEYLYNKHMVRPTRELPAILDTLRDRATSECKRLGLGDPGFNQCIVNNYKPGEGISPHTDAPVFGPIIACFTLGSVAEMQFTNQGDIYHFYPTPGSLYIMTGPTRSVWKHAMPARLSDMIVGEETARKRRISVTFRHVPPTPYQPCSIRRLMFTLLLIGCVLAIIFMSLL